MFYIKIQFKRIKFNHFIFFIKVTQYFLKGKKKNKKNKEKKINQLNKFNFSTIF